MRYTAALAIVAAAATGACTSGAGDRAGGAAEPEVKEIVLLSDRLETAPATPQWEPWPPPGATNVAREPATGPIVELTCPSGGMKALDLLALLSQRTGAVVLYDPVTNLKLKAVTLEWVGTWRVPASRLADAVRTALHEQNVAMAPVSLGGEGEAWSVLDMSNPLVKSHPVWVPEERLYGYEDATGLLVTTVLRVRDMVDTSRLRQALTGLSTMTAAIGRVQDVPNGRAIVVVEFAPVAASMKRIVDQVNASAVPPAPPVPGATPAPAPPK